MIMMESTTYLCIIEEFLGLGQGLRLGFKSLSGWGILKKTKIEIILSLLVERKKM